MKARYITLPENWDELTPEDWRELLRMREAMIRRGKQVTIEDVRIETARMLLQNRGVKLQLNNRQYLVLVSQLADGLDWLWQADDNGISLVYRTADNKLPRVRDWYGPMPYAADMTFGEFRMAVAILRNYEQEPSERALNMLAGLLYRPRLNAVVKTIRRIGNKEYIARKDYDFDDFEAKEQRGAKMQRWQVWGIYAWFAYFCEYLASGVFVLEGEEISFAPLFQKPDGGGTAKKEGGGSSLAQICHTLAETHVFGTAREVDRTLLFDVMQKLLQDFYSLQRIKKTKIRYDHNNS